MSSLRSSRDAMMMMRVDFLFFLLLLLGFAFSSAQANQGQWIFFHFILFLFISFFSLFVLSGVLTLSFMYTRRVDSMLRRRHKATLNKDDFDHQEEKVPRRRKKTMRISRPWEAQESETEMKKRREFSFSWPLTSHNDDVLVENNVLRY